MAVARVGRVLESRFAAVKVGEDLLPGATDDFIRTYKCNERKVLISRDDFSSGTIDVIFVENDDPAFIQEVKAELESLNLWV